MKSRVVFLVVSLLGNAGLVAAWLMYPAAHARGARAAANASGSSAATVVPSSNTQAREAAGIESASPLPSWTALDTPDLDEFVRRLRAAGFTPAEIRLILSRRISRMYAQNPGGETANTTPYWRSPYRTAALNDPERRKQIAEQQKLYRKYVNPYENLADDPDQLAGAKRRWGDLPVDKLLALAKIESDYEEMQLQQFAQRGLSRGDGGAAGANADRLLEQERMADIAKVLTPEKFAVYELRASPTATMLRYRLETFKPTEAEYKSIFAITKAYEAQLNDRQLSGDARTALNKEITAKVQAAIGADRALDYDAAVNQNSSDQTAGLVSRLNLPARVASEVRQLQQDYTQKGRDIRGNANLSSTERDAQLATLAQQAASQLTAKLGADGFEAYSDLKGEWLRALSPKPTPGAR
ncbi:MAG TPA: hypothetical protein VG734_00080 [Lacunisphaera sp.]|nr:hypothetical protein [Lacunisphaera sp.]